MKTISSILMSSALALCMTPALAQQATRIDTLAEMPGANCEGLNFGADGAIYCASSGSMQLLRYKDGKMESFAKLPIHALVPAGGPDGIVVNGHVEVDRSNEQAMQGVGRLVAVDYQGNVTKVVKVGSMPNGLTHYKGHVYFVSDTLEEKIWRVDMAKGEVTLWLADPLFTRVKGDRRAGINGIKVHGEYLYVASTVRESIYRIKIGSHGKPASAVTRVGFSHYADDFDIAKDGTIYVGTRNAIARISPSGETTDLTDGETVEGGPTVLLAPDGKSLYAATQGYFIHPPWGPPGTPQAPQTPPPPAPVPKLLRIWLP